MTAVSNGADKVKLLYDFSRCGMDAAVGKRMRELVDDEERTTSMGLFNTAEAYRLSAIKLRAGKRVKSGHADTPTRQLYYHALELYLKALLRKKHSVKTLRADPGSLDLRGGAPNHRQARKVCRKYDRRRVDNGAQ
jgi:hypothetical protein